MIPPTSIDGTDITGATIDGTDVQEITVDGDTVFSAGPDVPEPGKLLAYYSASEESFNDNDTTNTFTDFSGNGFDMTGSTATYKDNQINGQPAFEVSDGVWDNPTLTFSDPIMVATVFVCDVNNEQARLLTDSNDDNNFRLFVDTGQFGSNSVIKGGGSTLTGPSPGLSATTYLAIFDGSNSEIRKDGGSVTGTLSSFTVSSGDLDFLGTSLNTTRGLRGKFAEMLIYDSLPNISTVETHLSNKYATF